MVANALLAVDAAPALIDLARRAVDDELRHAAICRYVASRFAGTDVPTPARLPLVVPPHGSASEGLRHTLHVVGQCCLNETIASAVLEASIANARGALVTAALRELLSDEIDHGRIGWAHLATVQPQMRTKLERWLPAIVRGNLKMWRETPRQYATNDAMIEQGALSAAQTEAVLLAAIRDLVIPGFDRLGISTSEILRWLERGAPTTREEELR